MDSLKIFSIPFQGLKNGVHHFEYQIGSSFFKNFEDSAINVSSFFVKLNLEREINMIVLNFEFEGTMSTECDRCLEQIDMPMKGTQRLVVKFSEEEQEEEDNDEDIVYIHPKAETLNVAEYVYELVHLGLPFRRIKPECDKNLKGCPTNWSDLIIIEEESTTQTNSDASEEIPEESVWSVLNKLKN
jgi:uncharacterized protein